MRTEANKAVIRRWYEQGVNQGQLEDVYDLFHSDFVGHGPEGDVRGLEEGPIRAVMALRSAFPDIRLSIDDEIAEGDRVVTRWSATGTHLGEFMGQAPTGKTITINAIYIYRLEGGKIAELWLSPDTLGLMVQLGVVPPPD